ncbi:hypothetical protein [Sphingobium herbicidovorans]|uniref:hypothetical protein n=2 Tax=Sphingobium herbicidovorans TaxID=76947 RepID=UPI0012E7332F|nr:hypothetical protein [Sphingobium herbicidovorans]
MRYLITAAVMVLITVPSTLSAQEVRQVKYQRWGMFGGYKDKSIGQNSWKVIAGVNGRAPEGSAFNIALYRAAELSKVAGFKYFQIINQKGKQSYVSLGGASSKHSAGGDAELQIIAVNDPAAPENCLAERRELCTTLEADATMQRVSPFLKFPRLK